MFISFRSGRWHRIVAHVRPTGAKPISPRAPAQGAHIIGDMRHSIRTNEPPIKEESGGGSCEWGKWLGNRTDLENRGSQHLPGQLPVRSQRKQNPNDFRPSLEGQRPATKLTKRPCNNFDARDREGRWLRRP